MYTDYVMNNILIQNGFPQQSDKHVIHKNIFMLHLVAAYIYVLFQIHGISGNNQYNYVTQIMDVHIFKYVKNPRPKCNIFKDY